MFWQGLIVPVTYEKWNAPKGATIVDRFEYDGVKYIAAEFKHSPGKRYIYLA